LSLFHKHTLARVWLLHFYTFNSFRMNERVRAGKREREREKQKMIIISLWILQPINFYVSQKVTRRKFIATTPYSCAQQCNRRKRDSERERFKVDIIDTYFAALGNLLHNARVVGVPFGHCEEKEKKLKIQEEIITSANEAREPHQNSIKTFTRLIGMIYREQSGSARQEEDEQDEEKLCSLFSESVFTQTFN
jgi:hypothetical protein